MEHMLPKVICKLQKDLHREQEYDGIYDWP